MSAAPTLAFLAQAPLTAASRFTPPLVEAWSRPPAAPRAPRRRVQPTAVAAASLESYRAQEGFYDASSIFLPNSIIYSSLRRRVEKSSLLAAVEFVKELAAVGISGSSPSVVLPAKALAPREVVQSVLTALRDKDWRGVLRFASEKNSLRACSPDSLLEWLATSDYKLLLDVSTFFVAPQARDWGSDRKSCVISCVINTAAGSKSALAFTVSLNDANVWLVDGLAVN